MIMIYYRNGWLIISMDILDWLEVIRSLMMRTPLLLDHWVILQLLINCWTLTNIVTNSKSGWLCPSWKWFFPLFQPCPLHILNVLICPSEFSSLLINTWYQAYSTTLDLVFLFVLLQSKNTVVSTITTKNPSKIFWLSCLHVFSWC